MKTKEDLIQRINSLNNEQVETLLSILNQENNLKEPTKELTFFEKYGIQEFSIKEDEKGYYVNGNGSVALHYPSKKDVEMFSTYSTKEHAERIAKLQYLFKKALWIAEQLRDGYEWDDSGYFNHTIIVYEVGNNLLKVSQYQHHRDTPFYFQSAEKARQFIEIMGKDDLKYLLTGGEE